MRNYLSFTHKLACSIIFMSVSCLAAAHGQHVNTKPWKACEEAIKDAPCSYVVNETDLYKGSCQAMSEVLMCVRNMPIEKIEYKFNTLNVDPNFIIEAHPHEHINSTHSHKDNEQAKKTLEKVEIKQ